MAAASSIGGPPAEGQGTIADPADAHGDMVALAHREHRSQRTGQDHLPGQEGHVEPAQRIGEPGDRIGGRSLHGRAHAHGHLLAIALRPHAGQRSEEHTSELQSLMRISYAVFCSKKKKQIKYTMNRSNEYMPTYISA